MSTIATAPRQDAAIRTAAASSRVAAAYSGAVSALSDTADVAWRNLLIQLRTPQAQVFATIQPVIFLGLRVSDPEAAQAAAVPAVFLLVFTSAAFVPATAMPAGCRRSAPISRSTPWSTPNGR